MKSILNSTLLVLISLCGLQAQNISVEGYTYETGNRGYLAGVSVVATDKDGRVLDQTTSDYDGKYQLSLPMLDEVVISANKSLFNEYVHIINTAKKKSSETVFLKTQMKRAPGYIFEITLAEKRENSDIPVDAIRGAWIEAYNNTTQKEVLSLKEHEHPDFKVDLKKGNHYTILIRKEGYLAKRLEAFVDVKGCILCFEGVGTVEPGVSDNLTEGNVMGTLLANVEMERLYTGKKIEVENIYYDLGKWSIKEEAREALGKIATFLKDNPRLKVELGSHTDVRGSAASNKSLSEKRARAAAKYLTNVGDIRRGRITYKGYGESQVVNKCKEGVECTEEEHQENRRTELKILGLDADQFVPKSLAQMKKEEQLEKMILALSDEDQIMIEEGGELPEDLKQDLQNNRRGPVTEREFIDVPGGEYQAKDEKIISRQVVVFEGTDIPKAKVVEDDKKKEVINKQKSAEVGISEESYTLPKTTDTSVTDIAQRPSAPAVKVIDEQSELKSKAKEIKSIVESEALPEASTDDLEMEATQMIEQESKALEVAKENTTQSVTDKATAAEIEASAMIEEESKALEVAKEKSTEDLKDKLNAKATTIAQEKEAESTIKDSTKSLEEEATEMIKQESDRLEEKKKLLKETKAEEEVATQKITESTSTTDVVEQLPNAIPDDTIEDAEAPVIAWLDGYKIVIHYGNIQLDPNHEIYQRHVRVDEYSPSKGYYYYMVGEYKSEEEAQKFLNTYLKSVYPSAYIVQFDKGKKVKKTP